VLDQYRFQWRSADRLAVDALDGELARTAAKDVRSESRYGIRQALVTLRHECLQSAAGALDEQHRLGIDQDDVGSRDALRPAT